MWRLHGRKVIVLTRGGLYGYRPKRSAQQAIQQVKKYAEEGCTHVVSIDLSKYFDTLNHELLMDLLHRQIQDRRVLRLIKKGSVRATS